MLVRGSMAVPFGRSSIRGSLGSNEGWQQRSGAHFRRVRVLRQRCLMSGGRRYMSNRDVEGRDDCASE
jgi:hypothetical protein